ncbi:PhzF family phenazine biosynthesis isomerase [Streptomyces sp. CC77]|uniref:PhzF family phenazine biosynthesis isomerase n=1 Tax=Streptomyces sp. CC77 TaxID=1906739 RepID=UPI0008DEA11B|nr:PhzF family phenazine biosynthesis isomerase [Streptomyces sp. CC77]OII67041.1 phenazine biosynthesis protein PhzF [Streptomyces sp. CC77]
MSSTTRPDVLRYAAFTPAAADASAAAGHPAGVVLDASSLDEAAMQAVAAEVGYSETAFVTDRDDDGHRVRVRYFSPLAEVPFCGHATVATAVALAERSGTGAYLFDTPVGPIPVSTDSAPDGTVRAALGWAAGDLDPDLPPHVAFGGNDHLVLAAAGRGRLADLSYDFDGLADTMRRHGWTTLQLVWRESRDVFHVRDPFPVGGVVEDPATGAAAAAFGGYLRALGLVERPVTLTLRQGEDMGRPSELLVDVDPADPRVRVTGRAREIGGAA